MRNLSFTDRLIDELQHGLSTSHLRPAAGTRAYPADAAEPVELSAREKAQVAAGRKRRAISVERRPNTLSLASITYQSRFTDSGFALKVFILVPDKLPLRR